MIDYEQSFYTEIKTALRTQYPQISICTEAVQTPVRFPHVAFVEEDNVPYERTFTSSSAEKHSTLTYKVEVFSNKTNGKKAEAKSIMSVVDTVMQRMGFVRTMCKPIPNLYDNTIYRIIGMYRAVVDTDGCVYRR